MGNHCHGWVMHSNRGERQVAMLGYKVGLRFRFLGWRVGDGLCTMIWRSKSDMRGTVKQRWEGHSIIDPIIRIRRPIIRTGRIYLDSSGFVARYVGLFIVTYLSHTYLVGSNNAVSTVVSSFKRSNQLEKVQNTGIHYSDRRLLLLD